MYFSAINNLLTFNTNKRKNDDDVNCCSTKGSCLGPVKGSKDTL